MTTTSASKPLPGYSVARRAGDLVYLAGVLGTETGTGAVPAGAFAREAHQVMRNLLDNAATLGVTPGDIIKTTVYVTTFDVYAEFDQIYRSYFSEQLPARATVQVAGLLAEAKVEVEAVASLHRNDEQSN